MLLSGFKSVAELETAIQQYLDHHNAEPKPCSPPALPTHNE
jgi:hypothetical protein